MYTKSTVNNYEILFQDGTLHETKLGKSLESGGNYYVIKTKHKCKGTKSFELVLTRVYPHFIS